MCWKGWLLQMVVMASRPNYVPVTYDPYTNSLFLGDESNSYLNPNSGFQPDFVQILDTGRNRLHAEEWLVWNEVLQLPENAPDRIILVFTDGVTLLETEIDINVDRTFPAQATPTPLPTITPTMLPTTGPTPTVFVPTPTLIPTVTPLPRDGNNYDVVIYYNEDFVSVVNESGRFANFRPLAITSNSLPPFSRSMTFFALPYVLGGGKLENFPPFYCVQAFSGARFTGPGKDPNTCVRRVSWRNALTPGERYWLRSSFEMTYGLEVVASCQGLQVRNSQSECGFDLPEGAFNSFSN
jgi:hypothetical protein